MDIQAYLFEQVLVGNGTYQYQYIGEAPTGVSPSDPKWTIYKFAWAINPDNTASVSQIHQFPGVAWTDRATLNWPF